MTHYSGRMNDDWRVRVHLHEQGRRHQLTEASVYFDHPVHAPAEHTLNIDFLAPERGPSARVAVELTAESARALARAIEATLASAPPGLD